jgi:hypothetical protein
MDDQYSLGCIGIESVERWTCLVEVDVEKWRVVNVSSTRGCSVEEFVGSFLRIGGYDAREHSRKVVDEYQAAIYAMKLRSPSASHSPSYREYTSLT